MLRTGTVVDATLISAPSSTNNAEGERDPEMHQVKKGNQWYFGMKRTSAWMPPRAWCTQWWAPQPNGRHQRRWHIAAW